jgi:DNA polymerase elongation subunit (family B)
LFHSFVEDGIRYNETVDFQPFYGVKTDQETGWKDIYGNNLALRHFDTMTKAKEWKEENGKVIDAYGDINHPAAYIGQTYKGDITIQKELMNIYSVDIETYDIDRVGGFPKPEEALHQVCAVTFQNMVTKQYYTFGLVDYVPDNPAYKVHYTMCDNEFQLLKKIIRFFKTQKIDYLTGWFINGFDVPYLINRIDKVITPPIFETVKDSSGKEVQKQISRPDASLGLSPDGKIKKVQKMVNKRLVNQYFIQGVVIWDYLDLYQKFTADNRESYSLDYIGMYELGQEKLKYKEEYSDLNTLYEQNPKHFFDYNIEDVALIDGLDQKLKYIDLALSYAYMMKCDPENIFGTTRPWDALLYSELLNANKLCPPTKAAKKVDFMGGYVKDPIQGMHKWVTVYDIVSSYPNQIRSHNLSPETVISDSVIDRTPALNAIREKFGTPKECMNPIELQKAVDVDKLEEIKPALQHYKVNFTANGHFFNNNKMGFVPEIVGKIFDQRVAHKNEIKALKKQEQTPEIKQLISELDMKQYTEKIALNSLYGAMSSNYFRFFDIRIATAITFQGQICARGAIAYILKKFPELPWIYQDTDSAFISLESIVDKRFGNEKPDAETITKFLLKYQERVLEPVIHEFFQKLKTNLNQFQATIEMEHETISDNSIYIEKKKYAMKQVFKEGEWFIGKTKLIIKGIEVVRTSTPQIVRNKLKDALTLLFETGDNAILIKHSEDFKKEFFELPFETIASPRGVTFSDYTLQSKSLPIAVRAAYKFNQALKQSKLTNKYQAIGDGNKIKFCYIEVPNIYGTDCIACLDKMPAAISKNIKIDYKTQWEKTYVAPLSKIFKTIGWVFEKNQTALANFFED